MSIDPGHPALSPTRPLFIDNRDRNTMDRAIVQHLQTLRREMALPWEVCMATAFFNVPGFNLLADELDHVGHVRLLLGADPTPEAAIPPRKPGDPPEPAFTRRLVSKSLRDLDDGLRRARDLLPFDEPTDAALRVAEILAEELPKSEPSSDREGAGSFRAAVLQVGRDGWGTDRMLNVEC